MPSMPTVTQMRAYQNLFFFFFQLSCVSIFFLKMYFFRAKGLQQESGIVLHMQPRHLLTSFTRRDGFRSNRLGEGAELFSFGPFM